MLDEQSTETSRRWSGRASRSQERIGKRARWRFTEGFRRRLAVTFSFDEALALVVTEKWLKALEGAPLVGAAQRALDEVPHALPPPVMAGLRAPGPPDPAKSTELRRLARRDDASTVQPRLPEVAARLRPTGARDHAAEPGTQGHCIELSEIARASLMWDQPWHIPLV